ncbi:MAG: metallophosphoesterase [Megasphaera sp.]|jgi:predicted MPP superfamily phosphohydrolase|nr:metallophosphoesterase [Megasphaera sp.]MCI1247341.1 metallophosphoesterase [Megasphaera sp.]
MISLFCFTVLAVVLWNFINRTNHKLAVFTAAMAGTAVAVGCLCYYGNAFPYFTDGEAAIGWMYGSLASLGWLFMFILALPVLVVTAVGCAIYRGIQWIRRRLQHKKNPPAVAVPVSGTMSRRTFLKGAAAAIPVLSLGTGMIGNFLGEKDLAVTVHPLLFAGLPDYLEGYRIGQISDVHMGLFFSPRRLQEALDALAEQHVNRLVMTGDLIDEVSLLPEFQQILVDNAARFPDGIDFCYGNHEYYRGFDDITAMLTQTPVRILRNSHFMASPGRGSELAGRQGRDDIPFYIAGVDYSFARGKEAFDEARESYVTAALQGIPDNAFVILLAHHPDFIDEAFAHHIPLTLCGHTHGAQFAPLGPLVQAVGFKYLRGLFHKDGCYGYVNRGTGHWLPFRMGCSREVSVFEMMSQ